MTAVTTDGARIGVEHSDHSGCSFPFSPVTATSHLVTKAVPSDVPACADEAAVPVATDTVSDSTTRVATE